MNSGEVKKEGGEVPALCWWSRVVQMSMFVTGP